MTSIAISTSPHRNTALFLTFAMAAVVGAALGFEHIGHYIPCKLCLEQRVPYYVGVPVMALAAVSATLRWPPIVTRVLLIAGGLLMAWSLFLAWLLRRYGEPIRHFVEERLGLLAATAAAVLILLYFLVRYLH